MRLRQRALSLDKRNKNCRSQCARLQGERDSVAGKGIDERRRVAGEQHAARFGLSFTKVERRSADGRKKRLPRGAAALEFRRAGKDLVERTCDVSLHHGAGIHGTVVDRSDAAITTVEEIKIDGGRRRTLSKMRLQSQPFFFPWRLKLGQL